MSNRILLNIGFGNTVTLNQVVAIIQPGSAPVKRFIREKRDGGGLIDATMGKKVRALIITKAGLVVLSAISVASLTARMEGAGGDDSGAKTVRGLTDE